MFSNKQIETITFYYYNYYYVSFLCFLFIWRFKNIILSLYVLYYIIIIIIVIIIIILYIFYIFFFFLINHLYYIINNHIKMNTNTLKQSYFLLYIYILT